MHHDHIRDDLLSLILDSNSSDCGRARRNRSNFSDENTSDEEADYIERPAENQKVKWRTEGRFAFCAVHVYKDQQQNDSHGVDNDQRERGYHFPVLCQDCHDATDKQGSDDASDRNTVICQPDIKPIVEVGVGPLRTQYGHDHLAGKRSTEPLHEETEEHDGCKRPRSVAKGGAKEMKNGSYALAPVPTAGRDEAEFGGDVEKFFMQVAEN